MEIRIKGFDKNLQCRGMQFEIGKEYKIESTNLEVSTDKVFHYCKTLKEVNAYYGVWGDNRFCYIEVLGEEVCEVDLCGSNHIKILREIVGEELNMLLGKINGNTGCFNSGNGNTGSNNAGDCNSGHGNTGSNNAGNYNSGHSNTGNENTGNENSGDGNSGYGNSGNYNSGYNNSGDRNSGKFNSGDFNSGNWNSCNYSSGFFCLKEPKAVIFDTETDMTVTEFRESIYYKALLSAPFEVTEIVEDRTIVHTYKEACKKWWKALTPENKEIIKSIPNFNTKTFKEITGITIRNRKEG